MVPDGGGSTPAVTPSSTATGAPVLPEEAKGNTKAGAIAFVKHYVEVMNYFQRTGIQAPLSNLETPGCRSCDRVRSGISKIYGAGGSIKGGAWTVMSSAAVPARDDWIVTVRIKYSKQVIFPTRGGMPTKSSSSHLPVSFVVTYMSKQWKVRQWSRFG